MTSNLQPRIRSFLHIFFALSAVGWLNSLYTLWHRQNLMFGIPTSKSFCNISETVNCDLVAMSPESALFFGYPTSALGLMFYCVGFVLAAALYFSKSDENRSGLAKALLIVTVVGLIPTVLLAGISMFKLKALCLMCLAGYVINTGLLVVAFLINRSLHQTGARSLFQSIAPKVYGFCLASVALHSPLPYVFKTITTGEITKNDLGLYLYQHQQASKFRFRTEGASIFGNPDAKVQIVEFADFQCPACAVAAKSLPNVLASFRNEVSLVFKNFPLDSSCNPNLDRPLHPFACTAALAGICVQRKNGSESFFRFNKELFENHSRLSQSTIERVAQEQAGLDAAALKSCIESAETTEELTRQISEAKAAGVKSTPSIYVNGKALSSGFHPLILRTVIQEYLKH